MSTGNGARSDVLLVGSLPYDTAEEAIRSAVTGLRGHVGWVPDGEVGERKNWVGMLPLSRLQRSTPAFEETMAPPGHDARPARARTREAAAGRGDPRHLELPRQAGPEVRFDDLRYGATRSSRTRCSGGCATRASIDPRASDSRCRCRRRTAGSTELRGHRRLACAVRAPTTSASAREIAQALDRDPRRRSGDPVGRRVGVRRHGDGRQATVRILAPAHGRGEVPALRRSNSTTCGRASPTRRCSATTGATAPGAAGRWSRWAT